MTPPAPFFAFGTVWFFYFACIGVFNPYAPLWFKDLGFSTLAIGAIASLQSWTRVIAPYGWGWLGDHGVSRVRLVRLAAMISLVGAAGLLGVRDYAAVAVFTVVIFLANGGVVPLSEAMLAQHLKTADGMDTAKYGRVRMWGSVGFITAVVACGALLQGAGIGWFPALVVLIYVLLMVAALRLPVGRAEPVTQEESPPVLSVLRQPEVAWFFAAVFFTVLGHTSVYAFFSLYLDHLGYDKSVVGLLWAVSVLVEIAFFWAQGRIFGRMDAHRWLQWAAAFSVVRFAMTASLATSPLALVVAQALHAVTFASQHAACIVLINRHFPGKLRGRGQALYTVLGYGASGVIGGVGGGWLSSRLGFEAVFWAGSVAGLLGWACARAATRHAALNEEARAADIA